MTRRSVLVAVAYTAGTLAVLLLGMVLVSRPRGIRFDGDAEAVVRYAGLALLLLGAGRLVHRAARRRGR